MFPFKFIHFLILFTILIKIRGFDSLELYQTNQLIDSNLNPINESRGLLVSPAAPTKSDLFNSINKKKNRNQQQRLSDIPKVKIELLSKLLKIHVDHLRDKTDQVELVFLVDASASVGDENFQSELNFVRKLLSDFTVAPETTRVAVITFSSKNSIIRHVDQISRADENNHKCRLLNQQLVNLSYSGGGTYTRGALLDALDILKRSRSGARKAVFLITDGFSNGGDPRPAATLLKQAGAVVFTFGIRTGNIEELQEIASEPRYMYSYLLDSFPEFEALARRALHHDLRAGDYVTVNYPGDCDSLCSVNSTAEKWTECCDANASCACGISTGHYACLCHPGYFGSGFHGSCKPCPNGTYGVAKIPGDLNTACVSCPDPNHVTTKIPATVPTDCICASGFTTNGNKCDAITCPKLRVPENGYLVKADACNNVVNAACGVRCKIGFHLTGDSIRLCRKTGTWSGTETECLLKTCPALRAPSHGKIRCEHEDDRQIINGNLSEFPIDTHCEYKCDSGYQLRGSRARNCLPLSRWDGLKVSCRTIKCQPLRSVPNGKIYPEYCSGFDKVPFGTNCTIQCRKGFTLKGPGNKVCAGRAGSWTRRHHVTQCIDRTPPTIICPPNVTVETLPGKNYTMANFSEAVASDNDGKTPVIWSVPFVTVPWKIEIGIHRVKYTAEDSSKNKAECYLNVEVFDREPPTVENCFDPPTFLLENDPTGTKINWEEPVFYDNSGLPVKIIRSHVPGEDLFKIGTTKVSYTAIDRSNNTRDCVLNITVEDACGNLPPVMNGRSDCATLKDGVHCVITCAEGYTFVFSEPVSYLNDDNVSLTCNKANSSWSNDVFPDCSVTEVPYAVAQDLTIVLDANRSRCSEDRSSLNMLGNEIKAGLESQLMELCDDQMECNVSQSAPICEDEIEGDSYIRKLKRRSAISSGDNSEHGKRRKSSSKARKRSNDKGDKIEIKYKIIGKIIDNNKNNPKQGIKKLREKLEMMTKSGQLNLLDVKTNQEIAKLVLNLYVIFENPEELCFVGSILKKHSCVKCPLGTFHNVTKNQCQSCSIGDYQDEFGSGDCKKCPEHTSTRKKHSASVKDCVAICPPGYSSRRKRHRKSSLALEPCITCKPGFYQPNYDQTECISCPENTTTIGRGATSVEKCLSFDEIDEDPCEKDPCLNGGTCLRIGHDFSCKCAGKFIGSTCEILPNPCNSSPCLNEGLCIFNSSNSVEESTCLCKTGYSGANCEIYIDECSKNPCQNNGLCVSNEDDFSCVCQDGFEGDVCELAIDHCEEAPCESGSTCRSVNGTWQCTCKPGYLGRRCSRLPCDWVPCHENSFCINIEEINATKNSYRCECPPGFTGENCTAPIDHCADLPCLNNATCINNLLNYTCECMKEFHGTNCETELSSLYTMNFPKSGTTDYVMVNGPSNNLSQFTVCFWIQSKDTFNYGTVLSYATPFEDNALTLTDYNGFVIYINGNRAVTDITVNDGYWHFICITWENSFGLWRIFMDGVVKDNGTSLATGTEIEGNGTLVIGQEQDRMGGGFSESESLLGKVTLLDIWDTVLDDEVIKNLGIKCDTYHGSLYSWAQLQQYIHGNVEVHNSTFCHACPLPVVPLKGKFEVTENSSEVVYTCEKGYQVKFGESRSAMLKRSCLKQGQWEGYYTPTCTRIRCGFPGYFPRGRLHGRSYSFGDKIRYSCNNGSELRGNPRRVCLADGTWSGVQPLCIGKTCKNLLAPDNGDIEYLLEEYDRDDTSIIQAGQQLEFKCNPGSRLIGEAFLTCLENGQWDTVPPKCIPFGCPPPKAIDNGFIASNISSGVEMLSEEIISAENSLARIGGGKLEGYLYGDAVGFSCQEGFRFLGNRNMIAEIRIQCTNNGSWNGFVPDCVPLHCPRPDRITNGKFYLLTGNKTRGEIPMIAETFSNLTFIKKLVPISAEPYSPSSQGPFDIPISTDEIHPLSTPSNLTKRNTIPEDFDAEFNTSFALGSQISIICNKGYQVIGASVRTCQDDENWSLSAPRCEPRQCGAEKHPLFTLLSENWGKIKFEGRIRQGVIGEGRDVVLKIFKENDYLRGTLGKFLFVNNGSSLGSTITLACLNGTRIEFGSSGVEKILNNVTWTCGDEGLWLLVNKEMNSQDLQRLLLDKKERICHEAACRSPKLPVNGYVVNGKMDNSTWTAGEIIELKCRYGYLIAGKKNTECLSNGTWSSIPNCEPVNCGNPPSFPNSVLDESSKEVSDYIFGNMISYRCLPGYRMYGPGNSRCLANGKWSRMSGRCSRISCGKPVVPFGATVFGPSYLYGDSLTYVCPSKTKQEKIICRSDGKWSKLPDC